MRHAAPGTATEGQVVIADVAPQVIDRVAIARLAGRPVQLGQTDQVPGQLVGLAGGDFRCVGAFQRAPDQTQPRLGVGLFGDALGQFQVAQVAGRQM
jgi:hypothetical protein